MVMMLRLSSAPLRKSKFKQFITRNTDLNYFSPAKINSQEQRIVSLAYAVLERTVVYVIYYSEVLSDYAINMGVRKK